MKDFEKFESLQVVNRGDESIERLIKRFNKKVKRDGLLEEVYRRKYYEKPSDVKRRQKNRIKYIRSLRKAEGER